MAFIKMPQRSDSRMNVHGYSIFLPSSIRLGWKGLSWDKHNSLFPQSISGEEKKVLEH